MTESHDLRRTPLHDWHLSHHATMAAFGGYHMPLWYETGVKHEHCSVITAAGIFDTSHMAVLTVSGKGSLSLLQHCFSRDLDRCIGRQPGPLTAGRSVYGLFLLEDGTVLDDAIVSQCGPERYMLVVNSGMGAKVSAHLREQAGPGITVTDYTDQIGKIDLQGPSSFPILASLLENPEAVLQDMVYFSFKGGLFSGASDAIYLKDGTPVIVSRTGYTGEFGFELYVRAADTLSLWQQLLRVGEAYHISACGLASRDSLRTGALLPLSHQDIGNWVFAVTPWSFVLPWNENQRGFSKSFIGDQAVLDGRESSYTYGFAGYDPRKIPVEDDTVVISETGEEIGGVLTCTTDMAVGRIGERIISLATPKTEGRPADFQARGLSCGFIKVDKPCRTGEKVKLSAGRRTITVEIRDDIRPDRTARRSTAQARKQTDEGRT
jgi:aminomethyltransferase